MSVSANIIVSGPAIASFSWPKGLRRGRGTGFGASNESLLLVGSKTQDGIAADGVRDADDDANGSIRAGNLFERERVSDRVEASAAPLFRDNHSQQPKLCQPFQLLSGKARLLVILFGARLYLARDKLSNGRLHHSLLFSQF